MSAALNLTRVRRSPHLGALKFLSVGRTHAGAVRALNEDGFLDRADIGLWAVADGMGGHDCGDVASRLVVESLEGVNSFSSAYAFRDAVARALHDANEALLARALERGGGVIGSTVACLLAYQGHYACLWAGDSRVYLYRAGRLRQLTRDHSVVQEMVDAGVMRAEEARRHPKANVITRAVGARAALELEAAFGPIQPGDRFLLCSDGLPAVVTEREIAQGLVRAPLEAAADDLLARALSRKAPDNVTLILIGAEKSFAVD